MIRRASRTLIDSPSGTIRATSGCAPVRTCRHGWHRPQPTPVSHCRAAAKALAARDRPDPGGPVNSHAWVIPPPPSGSPERLRPAPAAAARSCATTAS
jgi:adenylate cyclase